MARIKKLRVYDIEGLQLKVSPFLQKEGEMIRCVNTESTVVGARKKRAGYTTYLGTADDTEITTLFNFTMDSGTQLWNYRASGGTLYYSTQGTGAWTICGNGTITGGVPVVHGIDENTLLISQPGGTTRHSTDGTSFTDTTSAPVAVALVPYQGRMWALGTESNTFYSTIGTPTDWTSDSSSIKIPGPGKLLAGIKANDRLVMTKNSGAMFRWDGFNLIDLATDLGPSSPYSVGNVEDYRLYLNRLGVFGYGGGKPEILSNPIEQQIYNDAGNGIVGTVFDNAPGVSHRYDYLCSVGDVTDDLTDQKVEDCIIRYDYQHDHWDNWKFANKPTAWCSYKDASGDLQLVFGDTNGQAYTVGGSSLTDNGNAIEVVMEGVLHGGSPELDKKSNYIWAFTNPGCQAKFQVAVADTFTKGTKEWIDMKQLHDGVMEAKFPEGTRGKLLFWRVSESSKDSRFNFYGFTWDFDPIDRS